MATTLSVAYSRTYNLGNYDSVKIHAGITKDLTKQEEKSRSEQYQKLFDEVMAEVTAVAEDIVPDVLDLTPEEE
jgi:hypothetical protein